MSDNANNVKKSIERIFNVPARMVGGVVKVNVKQINPSEFIELELLDQVEINIRRSGSGLCILVNPM